jgi:hypothetical protein
MWKKTKVFNKSSHFSLHFCRCWGVLLCTIINVGVACFQQKKWKKSNKLRINIFFFWKKIWKWISNAINSII